MAHRVAAPKPWLRHPRRWLLDAVLAASVTAATFLVHNTGYLFSTPYWVDEAWVAISTRLPLSSLPDVTTSSPLGWTFLLRLVPFGGAQRQRIIPLIFAALAVLVAYLYGRRLPWRNPTLARIAAVLTGSAALLVPSGLLRNDLKQYTADGFAAMLLLVLLAAVERRPARRELALLAAVSGVLFLVSSAEAALAFAAFAALVVSFAWQRRWRDAAETAVAGAAAGLILAVLYAIVYAPADSDALRSYWRDYFVPLGDGWDAVWQWFGVRAGPWFHVVGLGPAWLAVALVLCGVMTLVRLRCYATALFTPLLIITVIGMSVARRYPLFDIRTSHYLALVFAVTAAVGIGGLCTLAAGRRGLLAIPLAAAAVAVYTVGAHSHIRARTIPDDSVRDPVRYLAAHRLPTDAVVTNASSSNAYAYYAGSKIVLGPANDLAPWRVVVTDDPNLFVAPSAGTDGLVAALDRAAARVAGSDGRIWFTYMHAYAEEGVALRQWIAAHRYVATRIPGLALQLLSPPND